MQREMNPGPGGSLLSIPCVCGIKNKDPVYRANSLTYVFLDAFFLFSSNEDIQCYIPMLPHIVTNKCYQYF